MNTYITLLRGINVGGHNKLPMKALVELLSTKDAKEVQTCLQTGNVIFKAESTATLINELNFALLIERNFGFKPEVVILKQVEFELAVAHNPYQNEIGKTCHFYFCKDMPALDLTKIEALKMPSESYQLSGKVFYLHAPDGIGRSKLAAKIENCLGVSTTARNLNTVNKIAQLLAKS